MAYEAAIEHDDALAEVRESRRHGHRVLSGRAALCGASALTARRATERRRGGTSGTREMRVQDLASSSGAVHMCEVSQA